MPNLKSAKKRMRQNEVRREQNLQVRTRVKSARRAMIEALSAGDAEQGEVALRSYHSVLDKAAKKGVIAKNTAIRRKTNASNQLRKLA
ncbi:MAG: 30S ribosomal protein S20 [Kiritimatiellaceae bacterium]|nr:30S ribosomal protein S20 [Kiritimatiellaceae bacterium]RZO87343.1 MAG: 30S ribosomal protein S20 [Kiritimatiellaceae bacterium]|tara:strand:+ start:35 stop:298 length:264 start_codon:yes stop_codon:yes gene_type:complete